MSDQKIEQMAIDLKCDAPRVSMDLIMRRIINVEYQTVEMCEHKFMFCAIKMDNGFVVIGEPATCVDPANWRDEIGREISYKNSFSKIWALEGYRLASDLMPTQEI